MRELCTWQGTLLGKPAQRSDICRQPRNEEAWQMNCLGNVTVNNLLPDALVVSNTNQERSAKIAARFILSSVIVC